MPSRRAFAPLRAPALGAAVVGVAVAALATVLLAQSDPAALPPLLRLATTMAGVALLGATVTAGAVLPARRTELGRPAREICRLGAGAGVLAVVSALVQAGATAATMLDLPIAVAVGDERFWHLLWEAQPLRSLLGQACMSAIAAALLLAVRRPLEVAVPGTMATIALVLPSLAGHTGHAGDHVLGAVSIAVHIVTAGVWVGGLAGLGAAVLRSDGLLAAALPRFSVIALGCWIALGCSGSLVVAAHGFALETLLASPYGVVLLAKSLALVALGAVGVLHRRHLARLRLSPGRLERSTFFRLATVELLLMGGAFGLAAGLSFTPPPAATSAEPPFAEAPTFVALVTGLHPDAFGLVAAAALAVPYLCGTARLARRGIVWPRRRTVLFLAGVSVILLVTCTGFGHYAAALFSIHMAQHMALNMVAPLLLALGAPVTLALRALPVQPRRGLLRALRSRPAAVLAHPLVVTGIFVGSLYLLYFTPLFPALMGDHWGHALMQAHFLASGALYAWHVLGIDPDPHRPPPLLRVPPLIVVMLAHTAFAVVLVFGTAPIGGEYFASLAIDWAAPPLEDQALGGGIAWAIGEFITVGTLAALLWRWFERAERVDRARERHVRNS